MRIAVIGCGYLGAVHAAAMASLGHEVIGLDVDERKVTALSGGEAPFYEPGLPALLRDETGAGRLRFTVDASAIATSELVFIAVGTPQSPDGRAADLRFVHAALDTVVEHGAPDAVVVGKSTVPVGTAARLAARLAEARPEAALMWNPEFLREGHAVGDTLSPDRIVYGVEGGASDRDPRAEGAVAALDACYAALLERDIPRIVTDLETAELVKVSANAFLATKISFINAMAEVCEATGADVVQLADAIGIDARIGRRFLNAGLGFGGGCLPKDIRAFAARASELGAESTVRLLGEVDEINLGRRSRAVEAVERALGGTLSGRRIAVLGLAFKPDSDDVRDSPALDVARRLADAGAHVIAYDPEARATASAVAPQLAIAGSDEDALRGADCVVVLTEWQRFQDLDPAVASSLVANPVIVDARNCLDREAWAASGFTVHSLGRPTLKPAS